MAPGDSFLQQLQEKLHSQLSTATFNLTADFILVPPSAGQPLNLWTCEWDKMIVSNGVV